MKNKLNEIIRQSLVGLLPVNQINDIAPKVAEGISEADFKAVVKCKDCAGAEEHPASPAFYKCNGCNFTRGRLVSGEFWCKCGKRKEEKYELHDD